MVFFIRSSLLDLGGALDKGFRGSCGFFQMVLESVSEKSQVNQVRNQMTVRDSFFSCSVFRGYPLLVSGDPAEYHAIPLPQQRAFTNLLGELLGMPTTSLQVSVAPFSSDGRTYLRST